MKYIKFLLPIILLVLFVVYSLLPVRVDKKTVEIAYGTSTFEMALLLYKEGILRNPLSFLFLHSVEKKKLEADKAMPALICGSFGLMELFIPMDSATSRALAIFCKMLGFIVFPFS